MRKTSELIWQDTQHQVLFELIEQLKQENTSPNIFNQLFDYAECHFKLEESYMVRLNYPYIDKHITAHNKFREELHAMKVDQHKFDKQVRESISLFLREWLTRHVFGIDKDFEAFVLDSDFK